MDIQNYSTNSSHTSPLVFLYNGMIQILKMLIFIKTAF